MNYHLAIGILIGIALPAFLIALPYLIAPQRFGKAMDSVVNSLVGVAWLVAHIIVVVTVGMITLYAVISTTQCIHFWWGMWRTVGWGC